MNRNLLKKIESFYLQTLLQFTKFAQQNGYFMPDDPEEDGVDGGNDGGDNDNKNPLFNKLLRAANNLSDPDLSYELHVIAELYNKATELNGGYNYVNRAISNFVNLNLEDENDTNGYVEDILNEVVKDMRARAGGSSNLNKADDPSIIAQFKAVKNKANQEALQHEMETLQERAPDISQYDEKATSVLNQFEGTDDSGKGRGFSNFRHDRKNWVESYENEKQRHLDEISTESNPRVVEKLKQLVQILDSLAQAKKEEQKIVDDQSVLLKPEELNSKLSAVQDILQRLNKERSNIRTLLRAHYLRRNNDKLEKSLSSIKDDQQKFSVSEKIALNKLRQSNDKNKGEELKLRKILIGALEAGTPYNSQIIQDLIIKIQEAGKLKVPYEQVAKEQATKVRQKKESGNFEGLIIKFQQSLATQKIVVKQLITDNIKAEEHGVFQPYLDAINHDKNDPNAPKTTVKGQSKLVSEVNLQKKMNEFAETSPLVQNYVAHQKAFLQLRDAMNQLDKSGLLDESPINEETKTRINTILTHGDKLRELTYVVGIKGKDTLNKVKESMDNALNYLRNFL